MVHRGDKTCRFSMVRAAGLLLVMCLLASGCGFALPLNILGGAPARGICRADCVPGAGVAGVQVFVEPDAGYHPITDAIAAARRSIHIEMYLLSDRHVIGALEEAANRGVAVWVMLEMHPFGGGSPARVMDQLQAAGARVAAASSSFPLTHEKGMIVDGTTAYIMTSNFTRSALGDSRTYRNREYDIVDTNAQDVQAIDAIFQADWERVTPSINDANLVVSPINARNSLTMSIDSASTSLIVEGEEMNDAGIEGALARAARRGVRVSVVLPAPGAGSGDSNGAGIAIIKQGGVQVREDAALYIHAKMIVSDGVKAFVGSENISAQSLDQNRELGILVSDPNVIATLQQTFQQDWSAARNV